MKKVKPPVGSGLNKPSTIKLPGGPEKSLGAFSFYESPGRGWAWALLSRSSLKLLCSRKSFSVQGLLSGLGLRGRVPGFYDEGLRDPTSGPRCSLQV